MKRTTVEMGSFGPQVASARAASAAVSAWAKPDQARVLSVLQSFGPAAGRIWRAGWPSTSNNATSPVAGWPRDTTTTVTRWLQLVIASVPLKRLTLLGCASQVRVRSRLRWLRTSSPRRRRARSGHRVTVYAKARCLEGISPTSSGPMTNVRPISWRARLAREVQTSCTRSSVMPTRRATAGMS